MAVWGADDTITVLVRRTLKQVASRGGDLQTIHEGDSSTVSDYHGIDLLLGGGTIAAIHHNDGSMGLEVWYGEERTRLLEFADADIGGPQWSASGHILYERSESNEGVWALPFSAASRRATGEPFLVALGAGDHSD